jgi:hypothetical protein
MASDVRPMEDVGRRWKRRTCLAVDVDEARVRRATVW